MNQKNTLVSLFEQIAILNKNAVEIMTSLNDVVTDRNSTVDVNLLNEDGTTTTYYLPTVGQLKSEIDVANRNIAKLAGLTDNNVYVSDGTTMRKVYVDDLNREPEPINELNNVNKFVSINNSFFESLANPMLAVNINLTDKIDRKINKVLSRRYIVKFIKDDEGILTEDGELSKEDFNEKFLNRNDIYLEDFLSWYNNQDNKGILKTNNNQPYDEQVFDMDYDELEYYGVFDIIGTDNDSVNKKMWYFLSTLTYYNYSGSTRTLAPGDQLIINKKNSATKWVIKEVSTAKSNYRVRLERLEGLDAVPIMNSGLKIYSPELSSKNIKVSIGFDEYNLIFIKPINTDANILSSTWSLGTCYYSNDLYLNTNDTISMTKYYTETVFDYGTLLRDMIVKNIPSKYGVTPNIPNLDLENFKVVQINKHVTDTPNLTNIKKLSSQKISIKSRLEQVNDSITEKTREVNTASFNSTSDQTRARNELDTLISEQESTTKQLSSTVKQIMGLDTVSTTSNKYRIRGFWSFPEPQYTGYEGYKRKQEVVQFKIRYRYSSKSGSEPTTESFNFVGTQQRYSAASSQQTANDTSRLSSQSASAAQTSNGSSFSNPDVVSENVQTTAYFSNWNEILSDARTRKYQSSLDTWYWEIEDVSDADTPNINQLDIPVQKGEKVEIKVQSISEVGWPDAPLNSKWSDVVVIEFPDDLSEIGDENSFLLSELRNDQLLIAFQEQFGALGLTKHLQESFYHNDVYIAHMDNSLGTKFKDSSGNMIILSDYLTLLTDRIESLEEQVSRAKGELNVRLFNRTSEYKLLNGSTTNLNVIVENHATKVEDATDRHYKNLRYKITDFYLRFDNIAKSSQLGLLSYRNYIPTSEGDNRFYNPTVSQGSLATYVDSEDNLRTQVNNLSGYKILLVQTQYFLEEQQNNQPEHYLEIII